MGVLVPVPCGRSKDGERQIARTALGSNSSESIANACFLPFPGSKAFGLSALALNSGKPRRTAGSRGIHRPKITRNQQARGLDTHLPSNPTDGMRYEIGAYFFSFGSQKGASSQARRLFQRMRLAVPQAPAGV